MLLAGKHLAGFVVVPEVRDHASRSHSVRLHRTDGRQLVRQLADKRVDEPVAGPTRPIREFQNVGEVEAPILQPTPEELGEEDLLQVREGVLGDEHRPLVDENALDTLAGKSMRLAAKRPVNRSSNGRAGSCSLTSGGRRRWEALAEEGQPRRSTAAPAEPVPEDGQKATRRAGHRGLGAKGRHGGGRLRRGKLSERHHESRPRGRAHRGVRV